MELCFRQVCGWNSVKLEPFLSKSQLLFGKVVGSVSLGGWVERDRPRGFRGESLRAHVGRVLDVQIEHEMRVAILSGHV